MDIVSGYVYNFCMMPVMVKEAELNRVEVPENCEVLDATALGRRLGFKRDTVLAYLSKKLPPHTSPQPPACYGTCLVREERERVGREGRGSCTWPVGVEIASPRLGKKLNPMPRRCTVCDHPERHGIDEALVTGAPYRSVAKRFGLSESAVYRHKTEHLPAHLLKAREIEEAARADDLLDQVRYLQTHALNILERAEKAGDLRTALAAISQARGNLELLGKLAGELDERPVINLNVSPEWLELRAVIVGALEPYSEARGAVLRAIESSGNDSA